MHRLLRLHKARRRGGSGHCLEARIVALEARLQQVESRLKGGEGESSTDAESRFQCSTDLESSMRSQQQVGPTGTEAEDCTEECCLGESIWELPVYIGLPGFGGRCATALLLLTLLLSSVTQGLMCNTLLTSTSFNDPGFWPEEREAAERWRLTDAHDSRYEGVGGASLVSRVCARDSSISVASSQSELFNSITKYLDQPDLPWWRSTGPRLAVVCIFLFIVLIMEEQRALLLAVRALLSLPTGTTRVEGERFTAISKPRLVAGLLTGLMRLAVSTVVLFSGLRWLANTPQASDLILNCAALGFVFSVDEMLMAAFMPAVTQARLQSLEPVRLRRLPMHLEALLPLVVTVVVAVAATSQFLLPQMAEMAATQSALCDGRRGFTVYLEKEGVVTHQYNSVGALEAPAGLRVRAVDELRSSRDEDRADLRNFSIGYGHGTFAVFFEPVHGCYDATEVPTMAWMAAAVQANVAEMEKRAFTPAKQPFRCADYEAWCDGSEVVRRFCPRTCGCVLSPSSSLLNTKGCPQACLREARLASAAMACADHESPAGLLKYGSALLGAARPYLVVSFGEQVAAAWLGPYEAALQWGCGPGLADLCNKDHAFHLGAGGASTLHRFCPRLCCNGNFTDPDGICPPSCPAPHAG